ncbi:flagellar basal body P-ring formation chaperone FlgA [Legionella bononiensis]|uniref:Flagellar basal body P-ring formation protein FlgA n=1 Tax=Legionella bononiensis TaxID=2793102 RepID=A0ABS1WD58_9GAMM|nr:flagellar basal body P-ring formation chaperone FlgA [Legionella bononiensis]MBL7479159.1 flagellar basal body P-ring formation protein FlgA [Legionella bononiensis]MBL7527292.1 flagellar basal body P-ring formation protein FlgA [Legionella bononiensis]MBL7562261.1 flagellar basal body P-ring formation protein FlgA [Legionella bononiensis]
MKFVINLMIPFVFFVQAHAEAVMRFQKHITPHAQYLGDLVDISSDRSDLMKLPLDSHPKPGEIMSKKQIIDWVTKKTGSLDYQWKGKSTALVQRLIQTTGNELRHKAQIALEHQFKSRYDSMTLSPKGTIKDSEFPLSEFHIEIPEAYPPAKQICVRLSHGKHTIPIWFKISAFQSVLVAKYPISNRTQLHKTDFILKKRNIAGLRDKPLTKLPQAIWLKKSITKNHILIESDVAPTPQIIKGQWVQVTVMNRSISLLSRAIAEHDGYTGQLIRMKNPLSNKYFVARVTAPHQAEVSS